MLHSLFLTTLRVPTFATQYWKNVTVIKVKYEEANKPKDVLSPQLGRK